MTWRIRALLIVGVMVVLVVLGAIADAPRRRQRDEMIRRSLYAKAQILKEDLDRAFPVGAAQGDAVDFLRRQPTDWRIESEERYFLSMGRGPSGVWYCGPEDIGIWTRFNAGRLVSTEVGSWNSNCL